MNHINFPCEHIYTFYYLLFTMCNIFGGVPYTYVPAFNERNHILVWGGGTFLTYNMDFILIFCLKLFIPRYIVKQYFTQEPYGSPPSNPSNYRTQVWIWLLNFEWTFKWNNLLFAFIYFLHLPYSCPLCKCVLYS